MPYPRSIGHDRPYWYVFQFKLFLFWKNLILYCSVISFDLLIEYFYIGTNTLLLRASKDREAKKHFGPAPGVPGSHTKPYVRAKGRKFEKAKSI
jgi:hypothetical protein